MSAVKLEKKVAALERRLQDEMHAALGPLVQRLDKVEELLRNAGRLASADSTPTPKAEAFEADLSGVAVVPQPKESKEDVLKLQVGNWTEQKQEPPERREPVMAEVSDEEEPIPFAETIWNVVLVLGHSGAGWVDVIIACLFFVLGTFMQAVFMAVLLSDNFLGDSVGDQVEAARQWRAGSAHDVKHMDLAMTSLVSRVCSGDGSLILSTGQADLISEINQYLGIQDGGTEPQFIPPGSTLCVLCIGLWCVVLGGEFRAIGTSLVAASQIPRAKKTIMDKGSFVSISYFRFACYLLFRLARTAVAFCLLIAGTQWLARTSNITDLILNAVALEAILQIDEIVFASLFPKKIQAAIYELEPVKVRYSQMIGQLESCAVGLLFCSAVLVPVFLWVGPITETMLAVKVEYCGGNQNFVVDLNQEMQMYMGFATVPYDNVSNELLGQQAVMEHANGRLVNGSVPKYISFAANLDSFELNRVQSMSTFATQFPFCLDYDNWSPSLLSVYGPHFRSAALQNGRETATSCAELADLCMVAGARLVRMVCGRTCGCADPRASQWFKVPSQGCPAPCRQEAVVTAGELPCTNANTTENWQNFWTFYPSALSLYLGTDILQSSEGTNVLKFVEMMQTLGCDGLNIIGPKDVVTSAIWCEGSESLFGPLALICPAPCGCLNQNLPTYCPASCKSCGDSPNFPPNPVASNCAEAKAAGICEVQEEAEAFCSETCGICNGTADFGNATCEDGQIPAEFLDMECATLKALGWCGPLTFLDSPLSRLCPRSCGLC